MKDHRVRLDDQEVAIVLSALRARYAGAGTGQKPYLAKLIYRLTDMRRGNPELQRYEELWAAWHAQGGTNPS